MEQMTWDDMTELDNDILEPPIWNDANKEQRTVILNLIAEFVAQNDTIDKAWNELETRQQVLLLSRGILGD